MSDILQTAGKIEQKRPIPMSEGRTLDVAALVFVIKGRGRFEINPGQTLPVTPGTLMILHPGKWHRFDPDRRWTEYYLAYDAEEAERRWEISFPPTVSLVEMELAGEFRDAFEGLVASFLSTGANRRLLVQFHLSQLLHLALLRVRGAQPHPRHDLMGYIQRHLLEHNTLSDHDLQEVARRHGMDYDQFRYRFKKETGLSPKRYWLKGQMERAKRMLRLGDLGVAEIARACGFHSATHFSTTFRQAVGIPPSAWREAGKKP